MSKISFLWLMKRIRTVCVCSICVWSTSWGSGQAMAQDGSAAQFFDVPRLRGIVIDGTADDWGGNGFQVNLLPPVNNGSVSMPIKTLEDHSVRFRLGWDEEGLLLLVSRSDDKWLEEAKPDRLGVLDCIELYMAPAPGDPNICQWVITPGMTAEQAAPRHQIYDYRRSPELTKGSIVPTYASTRNGNSCTLEVRLP